MRGIDNSSDFEFVCPDFRATWDHLGAIPLIGEEPFPERRGRTDAALALTDPARPCNKPSMTQGTDPRRVPPILADKDYASVSVFEPANLLREARRQKCVPEIAVPEICILDPDGDILRV